MRRVAVTGLGIISTLGNSLEAVCGSLRAGRSGIIIDEERRGLGFRSALTGAIRDFDPADYFPRKARRAMGEPALYGCAAALQAVRAAELREADLQSDEVGVIVGNDSCCQPAVEVADEVRRAGPHGVGSGQIIRAMNSTVTMNLSTLLGTRGANWTVAAACASGAHAIGQGYALIRGGLQQIVLCGGTQEINWQAMAAFDALGAFSTREAEPEKASRPFDAARDGLVPSGGGAVLVLEDLERARARGARIWGEIVGYAFSSDGAHLTQPSGDGAVRAMRRVLAAAAVAPAEVDYVNAHATSTLVGDAVEAKAIASVFGGDETARRPWVSSTKSMTGHECWMAGASETLYTLLMMAAGFVAPNINVYAIDPACAGVKLATRTVETPVRTALVNSFGFGGTNATLMLRALQP
jgi:3-oxoacyl-[acyl-carrier-protein] synthase-1